MTKHEKLILLGKSGSGKDYLMRKLVDKGLKAALKWTTRPARKNETQGITYNFVENDYFLKSINENKFLNYQKYTVTPEGKSEETWYYGITNEEFESSQVFIMTPAEFSAIDKKWRKELFVVYLDIPRDVRESRLFKRNDKNDSIKRRMDADDVDFENFRDWDLRITDPDFTADDVYDLMD